jgi:spore germination protein
MGEHMGAGGNRLPETPSFYSEADPWGASPVLTDALQAAQLDDQTAALLRRYRQTVAQLEWGGSSYEPGSLEMVTGELGELPLTPSLGTSLAILRELLQGAEDLICRGLETQGGRRVAVIGLDGLTDEDRLEQHLIRPLVSARDLPDAQVPLLRWLDRAGAAVESCRPVTEMVDAVSGILDGDQLLLVDGFAEGLIISIRGWEKRAVSEPMAEPSVHGPKEAFTESIRTMTTLIRRRLRSPHLKFERYTIGRFTRTPVDLVYLQGTVSPDLVLEARRRLARIEIDALHSTTMLEEMIEYQPSSIFPQFQTTERPDRVVAYLMEGHIAFLVDGAQNAKIAPVSFGHFLKAPDDYDERFWYGTLFLWLRFLFQALILVAPSIYVAVITIHPDMLPTRLVVSLAGSREGIPYPAVMEILIMELIFEGVREASTLLPKVTGGAVTIVGALVIGEGAIRSGLASAPTVLIVAITGVASFTLPSYTLTIGLRLARFGLHFLGAIFGLFGTVAGLLVLVLHLASLRSFGRPYLQPVAPFTWSELKDTFVRVPRWMQTGRPAGNRPLNKRRLGPWPAPGPKHGR